MNHITSLQAQLEQERATRKSLEASINDLRVYIASSKFAGTDALAGYVNTMDVDTRLSAAFFDAVRAGDDAYHNAVGPAPEASHQGWQCPVCKTALQDSPVWNDTDNRAADRMRQHWIDKHQTPLSQSAVAA